MPEGARVSLLLDKPECFLGENVLVHYCIENKGDKPFTIEVGGDYRGTSRHVNFSVTAIGVDGQAAPDPDPSAPMRCMGGLGGPRELRPGEKFVQSLPLVRYCRIEKPGLYTVRVHHGHGWRETDDRKLPHGEAKIKFLVPTEEQAKAVVEEMHRLPKDRTGRWGERSEPCPDSAALGHAIYLPLLLERARAGSEDAVRGIGQIATPEATQALLGLLEHTRPKLVLAAADALLLRVPSPPGTPSYEPRFSYMESQRAYFVPKCWRPEFAVAAREHAARLLASDDPEAMARAADIFRSLGTGEDIAAVIHALDRAAALLKPMTSEEHRQATPGSGHERARRACLTLMSLVDTLARGGFRVPIEPRTAGEAMVFARAIGLRKEFRRDGWEAQFAKALQHEQLCSRLVALENLPKPAPAGAVKLVADRLAETDRDLLVAACDAARRLDAPELREPVLAVVRRAKDDWLLWQADEAARALGARLESMTILASRLDDSGIEVCCFNRLISGLVEGTSGSSLTFSTGTGTALKPRWLRFLQINSDRIRAGKPFRIGEPELTKDIFPTGFTFHRKGQPDWP